jgi:hypothetical protein
MSSTYWDSAEGTQIVTKIIHAARGVGIVPRIEVTLLAGPVRELDESV